MSVNRNVTVPVGGTVICSAASLRHRHYKAQALREATLRAPYPLGGSAGPASSRAPRCPPRVRLASPRGCASACCPYTDSSATKGGKAPRTAGGEVGELFESGLGRGRPLRRAPIWDCGSYGRRLPLLRLRSRKRRGPLPPRPGDRRSRWLPSRARRGRPSGSRAGG